MANLRNKDLHVVPDPDELTDRLVKQIMDEDNSDIEIEEQIKEHKKQVRRKTLIGAGIAAVICIALFFMIYLPTYTSVSTADDYGNVGVENSSFQEFEKGVLKYSRDGVSYLNMKGEEQWNQSYQIKTPTVVTEEKAAIIYDKDGNDIVVLTKNGMKGEIHTTLPIEKADVSEQGIVCAILTDNLAPKIICYDSAGNILVEHQTSLTGTGYPVDARISPNGEVMQVVYLYVEGGQTMSKVAYYNFGDKGDGASDYQVAMHEYSGTVMANGFFMNQNISVAIGDNLFAIYKGGSVPEEVVAIELDKEIKSVCYGDKCIVFVLYNEDAGYELRLYNTSGKQVLSREFEGNYSHIKMSGNQIIMYDGKTCSIYLGNGIHRFVGEMEANIHEILPAKGVNKYIVINANGMGNVRLVK